MRLRKSIIQMRWQPHPQTYCMPKLQIHYLTNLKEKHNLVESNFAPASQFPWEQGCINIISRASTG